MIAGVFWIGAGKKHSYEEARAQASKKAEEALKERVHSSPKAKKPRRTYRRKKAEESSDALESVPPRKGILKPPSADVDSPQGRLSPNKVEFKLESPSKPEEKTPRLSSPPTPYPTKADPLLSQHPPEEKTPQPIFEESETVDLAPAPEPKPAEVKKKQPSQQGKAKAAATKAPQPPVGKKEPEERVVQPKEVEVKKKTGAASAAASSTSSQKKSKVKGKVVATAGNESG